MTAVKHRWVEEPVDLYLNRYLAARVVRVLLPTPVTPNQISVASAAFGVLGGVLVGLGTRAALAWAAGSLMLSILLDCVDGQLARARCCASRAGRMFDGAADYLTGIVLHLGLWRYLETHGGWVHGWSLLACVALAGLSIAVHSALYDSRKQWFLAHVRPTVSQSDDLAELRREIEELSDSLVRLPLRLYFAYARMQYLLNRGTDSSGRVFGNAGERDDFLNACRPFLRLLVWLGPTTHIMLLLLATFAALFIAGPLWWYLFAVTVPMNLLFVIALVWSRGLDARFTQ